MDMFAKTVMLVLFLQAARSDVAVVEIANGQNTPTPTTKKIKPDKPILFQIVSTPKPPTPTSSNLFDNLLFMLANPTSETTQATNSIAPKPTVAQAFRFANRESNPNLFMTASLLNGNNDDDSSLSLSTGFGNQNTAVTQNRPPFLQNNLLRGNTGDDTSNLNRSPWRHANIPFVNNNDDDTQNSQFMRNTANTWQGLGNNDDSSLMTQLNFQNPVRGSSFDDDNSNTFTRGPFSIGNTLGNTPSSNFNSVISGLRQFTSDDDGNSLRRNFVMQSLSDRRRSLRSTLPSTFNQPNDDDDSSTIRIPGMPTTQFNNRRRQPVVNNFRMPFQFGRVRDDDNDDMDMSTGQSNIAGNTRIRFNGLGDDDDGNSIFIRQNRRNRNIFAGSIPGFGDDDDNAFRPFIFPTPQPRLRQPIRRQPLGGFRFRFNDDDDDFNFRFQQPTPRRRLFFPARPLSLRRFLPRPRRFFRRRIVFRRHPIFL